MSCDIPQRGEIWRDKRGRAIKISAVENGGARMQVTYLRKGYSELCQLPLSIFMVECHKCEQYNGGGSAE